LNAFVLHLCQSPAPSLPHSKVSLPKFCFFGSVLAPRTRAPPPSPFLAPKVTYVDAFFGFGLFFFQLAPRLRLFLSPCRVRPPHSPVDFVDFCYCLRQVFFSYAEPDSFETFTPFWLLFLFFPLRPAICPRLRSVFVSRPVVFVPTPTSLSVFELDGFGRIVYPTKSQVPMAISALACRLFLSLLSPFFSSRSRNPKESRHLRRTAPPRFLGNCQVCLGVFSTALFLTVHFLFYKLPCLFSIFIH